MDAPKCVERCSGEYYQKNYADDKIYASKIYQVKETELEIQKEIMTNGPVEAGFLVYDDFLLYKSGVYQHAEGKKIGLHNGKIIGWGVENGVNYWLVVNSFNIFWGDFGKFKILRGKNNCDIEANVVAGLPKI